MQHPFRGTLYAAVTAALSASILFAAPAEAVIVDPDEPSKIVAADQYPALVDKLIARGDYAEALAVIDEALAKNPLSVQLRFQRCVAYEKKGDAARAVKLYEDFITRYPEIPEPYNNLAAILAAQGNLDRAQSLVERSLALRPSFALAYDNLGQIYLAKARNAFDSALANAPGNRTIEKKLRAVDAILK